MTNTDYADHEMLPSCALVDLIEALRHEAAAAGKQKRFERLCERSLDELADHRETAPVFGFCQALLVSLSPRAIAVAATARAYARSTSGGISSCLAPTSIALFAASELSW
jgi:hypothetical protein